MWAHWFSRAYKNYPGPAGFRRDHPKTGFFDEPHDFPQGVAGTVIPSAVFRREFAQQQFSFRPEHGADFAKGAARLVKMVEAVACHGAVECRSPEVATQPLG